MRTASPTRTRRHPLATGGALTVLAAVGVCAGAALTLGLPPAGMALRGGALLVAWLAWVAWSAPLPPAGTLGPADWVTLGRGVLVALLAAFLGAPPAAVPATALAVLGLVALGLDGLDGTVARRTGRASPFGASLDMELDAATVLLLSALAWWLGHAGPWVLIAGALRYAWGLAAWASPRLRQPLPPYKARRWVAGFAVGGLALTLLPALSPVGMHALAAAVVAALLWSFGRDAVWCLWRAG